MPLLKAHGVERFLAALEAGRERPPPCVLAYGPDRGLVSDCLRRFAAATPVEPGDALANVVLDGAALAADPGRLRDELNGPGLFGGARLVRLREAGNDKRVVAAVAAALAEPSPDAFLAIEAGELKRGAALLKPFERAPDAFALPCYADDVAALERTVRGMIEAAGKRIEPEGEASLLATLGGDRLTTRSEIDKLLLYVGEDPTITEADVRACVGDAAGVAADEAVDGALAGDGARFERAYARVLASKGSTFLVLRDLAQQLQWLERAWEGAANERAAARRLESLGGRVHFRRLPALRAAIARLPAARVSALLDRATATVLETRRRPALESELARALCLEVARPAR